MANTTEYSGIFKNLRTADHVNELTEPIFEVKKNKRPGLLTTVEVSHEPMARLT